MVLEVGPPSTAAITPNTNEQYATADNESMLQYTTQTNESYYQEPGVMVDETGALGWDSFHGRDNLIRDQNGLVIDSGTGWPEQQWNANNEIPDVATPFNIPFNHIVPSQGHSPTATQSSMGDQVAQFNPPTSYDINEPNIPCQTLQCICGNDSYLCSLGRSCSSASSNSAPPGFQNMAGAHPQMAKCPRCFRAVGQEWNHDQINQFPPSVNCVAPSVPPTEMDRSDIPHTRRSHFSY